MRAIVEISKNGKKWWEQELITYFDFSHSPFIVCLKSIVLAAFDDKRSANRYRKQMVRDMDKLASLAMFLGFEPIVYHVRLIHDDDDMNFGTQKEENDEPEEYIDAEFEVIK